MIIPPHTTATLLGHPVGKRILTHFRSGNTQMAMYLAADLIATLIEEKAEREGTDLYAK